jgi:uncharacterized secreted protein with C-terminal beta-propeller domain
MAEMTWRVATGNEIYENNDIKSIESCEALTTQVQKANLRSGNVRFPFLQKAKRDFLSDVDEDMPMLTVLPEPMITTTAAPSSANESEAKFSEEKAVSGGASDDYSTTNIQEKGVDEADVIKNDGSHIFYARGEDVRIVRAYPVGDMKEESKITVEGMRITELLLDGDTLVALGTKSSGGYYYGYNSGTEVRIFNISDRKNPIQIRSVSLDGNLVSSRRVGDTLYLVANNYLQRQTFTPELLPVLRDGAVEVPVAPKCGDIQYFPNFRSANLVSVVAVDTKNPEKKVNLQNFLGAGDTIYSSPENLYIVRADREQVFTDKNGVAKWTWENISNISKVSLDGLNIALEANGKVPGRVLNQYSMSEHNGLFRIATHKNSENLVTILNSKLKNIGEIRNIAPGENIKSARFMGERGFLVTFKAVDPLFVLNLNPADPKVLGELKIPGWSDYLHPIDDNYLIGFGKEVNAESANNDRLTWDMLMGMKLAIFDVSDLKNPKEIHKTVIGDRGTESEILSNPRSLFYDANRKLIGFPITIQMQVDKENKYSSSKTVFSGAQVYTFSIEDGFSLFGEVSHFPEYITDFYDQNYKINRIVRIGENYYSASKGMIKGLSAKADSKAFNVEETISFLKAVACEEITNPMQCEESINSCKALYTMPECPEGEMCIQAMQFEKCVKQEEVNGEGLYELNEAMSLETEESTEES